MGAVFKFVLRKKLEASAAGRVGVGGEKFLSFFLFLFFAGDFDSYFPIRFFFYNGLVSGGVFAQDQTC